MDVNELKIISRDDARAQGLKRYYQPNHVCTHGHDSERYVLKDQCIECLNDSKKRWFDKKKTNGKTNENGYRKFAELDSEHEAVWRRGLLEKTRQASNMAKLGDWSRYRVDAEIIQIVRQTAQLWDSLATYVEALYAKSPK